MWRSVRPATTQEISKCKVDQDQSDDTCPDEIASSEIISQKTGSGKFHGQTGHPGEKHAHIQQLTHPDIIPTMPSCKIFARQEGIIIYEFQE